MKFILGKKIGMTQVFREDGTVVPVTRVLAGPCVITQVKTKEKDGADAVQVGFGKQKMFRLKKAQQGHLKDLESVRFMRDFRIDEENKDLKRGDTFTVKIFEPGDTVQVTGKSKGRGFQGVVKRHGFHGSPASHGHKDQLRMPGSIGATDSARVFKGTRMGGHMGDAQVTVQNLEIVEIDPEKNELLIKGAVPGARNGLLEIVGEGKMDLTQPEPEVEAEKTPEEKTTDVEEQKAAEALEAVKADEEKKEEPKAKSAKETKMGFYEKIVPQVFEGKTRTYRLREHNIEVGDKVEFENSQTKEIFGEAVITNIEKKKISEIELPDPKHGGGYEKTEELIEAFKRHYPDLEVTPDIDAFIYDYEFKAKEKETKETTEENK